MGKKKKAVAVKPVVSVVMPAYNAARYIAVAITAVLNQSFRQFELIIVDDGSTDETPDIVHTFTDPRIMYIYQGNGGICRALNTGIRSASAKYFCRADTDDISHPQRLALSLAGVQSDAGAAGVYGDCVFFEVRDDSFRSVLYLRAEQWNTKSFLDMRPSVSACRDPVCLHEDLMRENFISNGSVMLKTAALKKVGMFDESLEMPYYEDWDLWLRLTRAGHRLVHVPRVLYFARRHPASMSTDDAAHADRARSYADFVRKKNRK